MKKFLPFMLVLTAVFISIIIIFTKGNVYTGPEVFLPGYKYGKDLEEIKNENVKNFVKVSKDFNDGSNILLILYDQNGFFNKENTLKLKALQREFENSSFIKGVLSPLNLVKIEGFNKSYYVSDDTLQKSILNDPNAENLISHDGKYVILNLIFKPDINARKYTNLIEEKTKKLFDKYYLFGEPVIDSELFKELLNQTYVYPVIMFVLIVLFFYFQVRSFKISLFIVFVPIISSIITMGMFFLTGRPLNTLTVMMVSFLLIIGSGYGLHFYNAFHRFDNIDETKKHISKPILFSMLTTVAGFLSFLFVEIEAFKELGILVSIGLSITVGLIFLLGGNYLKYLEKLNIPSSLGIRYLGNKVAVISFVIFVIIGALSPFIIKNISIKSDMVSYFSKNSKIGTAYKVMEDVFNFREPIYLVLEKDTPFLATDNDKIKIIKEKLEENELISNVSFPNNIPLPFLYNLSKNTPSLSYFISSRNKIRLIVYLTSKGYYNVEKVKELIASIIPNGLYKYYVAGSAFIWADINKSIRKAQIQSLSFASILIFIMVFIIFRKIRSTISVMIPIFFTAIMNFVFMAVFKINLDISTSITSSILMGLVIDYSIHLASEEYRIKDPRKAVLNVGPPILANGLGLILGFSVLLFSSLKLFKSISILIILGIGVGLYFTLLIQPFLLKKRR
ncbi:MAG: RND family transporter [Thermosipho sp. (in: Bacteria)]|nr:RND family transporter [Thermosipho sp. (in: thermotogales)]